MGTRATSHLSFLVSYRHDYYLFDYLFKGASLFSTGGIPVERGFPAAEADNARGRFKRRDLASRAHCSDAERARIITQRGRALKMQGEIFKWP